MSRRILKFAVSPGVTAIETVGEPRFLAVGARGRGVVVWAEADIDGTKDVLTLLRSVMTGDGAPDDRYRYVGTAEQSEGIVVHVYQAPGKP